MFIFATYYGFNTNVTVPGVLSIYRVKLSSRHLNILLSGKKKLKENIFRSKADEPLYVKWIKVSYMLSSPSPQIYPNH